ncbi:MAG: hypothetical protein Q7S22_05180 [Candidatus Micrarchaeota archaeon]|nr:hypothetical protein [Candidatus Micrarchaeota archaeon]
MKQRSINRLFGAWILTGGVVGSVLGIGTARSVQRELKVELSEFKTAIEDAGKLATTFPRAISNSEPRTRAVNLRDFVLLDATLVAASLALIAIGASAIRRKEE